ncbi:MAG TPA: hypothetical protein ENK19_02375 [Acidobacteria bacterium]|nr:hypothetical protein [Acidobacteriota bacterium]
MDMLGFAFSETPAEAPLVPRAKNQVSQRHKQIYDLVNGKDDVNEVVLQSPYLEFETCKALAELLDNGLIRESAPEELARELSTEAAPVSERTFRITNVPWLAVLFLALLGVSISIIPQNPLNLISRGQGCFLARYVDSGISWFRMRRILAAADLHILIRGVPPQSLKSLVKSGLLDEDQAVDPQGKPYRLVIRGQDVVVAAVGQDGQPVPGLILSHAFPWEGPGAAGGQGPGVVLLH